MKYTAEEARKKSIFKLLWAMYDDLLEERLSTSPVDRSGTIIGWYSRIIEERVK